MTTFSDNLTKYRKQANISRKELASILGVSIASVGFYETGRNEPDLQKLAIIANTLHVSIDDLLGYDASEALFKECVQFIERAHFGLNGKKDIGVVLFADGEHVKITDKTSARYLNTTPKDDPSKPCGIPIAEFSTRQEFIKFVQQIKQRTLQDTIFQGLLSVELDSARRKRKLAEVLDDYAIQEHRRMSDMELHIHNLKRRQDEHDDNSDK